jgi:threonyl-tRNA synthetase
MMIHADRFSFEVTAMTSGAGSVDEPAPGEDRGNVDDAVVAFLSVETVDESAPRDIAERAVAQVSDSAHEVGADRVMIYPYAHLSSDLARPRIATKVIAPLRPPSGEG